MLAADFFLWGFICTGLLELEGLLAKKPDKNKCPQVRSWKQFDIASIEGDWLTVRYFASSEECAVYRCMRNSFILSDLNSLVFMNFSYSFLADPDNERLSGNLTWRVPDSLQPGHWIHAEDTYEGVYNTYVLDVEASGDKSWLLLLHCAEKESQTRYLSSFVMTRLPYVAPNVEAYLKGKLEKYDLDLDYLFDVNQNEDECSASAFQPIPTSGSTEEKSKRKYGKLHPLKG